MILDHIQNSGRHLGMHPGFKEAFEFISGLKMQKLKEGRLEISGDRLYAIVINADAKGKSGTKLETHGKYIDIQYQAAGMDCIGWAPVNKLCGKVYDPAKDVAFYDSAPESWINIPAGCFAVFFPEDAHAPMGGEGRQLKIVVKVKVC